MPGSNWASSNTQKANGFRRGSYTPNSPQSRGPCSAMRRPARSANSITRMPRSKYSGSERRTFSNFSGYSAASTANPMPVDNTPAAYLFFINKTVAAPIDPATTAFFHASISLLRNTLLIAIVLPDIYLSPVNPMPVSPAVLSQLNVSTLFESTQIHAARMRHPEGPRFLQQAGDFECSTQRLARIYTSSFTRSPPCRT